jgi:hypothetical protein
VDPLGLLTEIIIWQPVGWGQSSFGHVSTNVNGTTYTFGPQGLTVMPTSEYLNRNTFREGLGFVLGLTPDQEAKLQACLSGDPGKFNAITNNCGATVQNCLSQIGFNLGSNILPVNLGYSLMDSLLPTNYNFYPATQPSKGSSAPWAK